MYNMHLILSPQTSTHTSFILDTQTSTTTLWLGEERERSCMGGGEGGGLCVLSAELGEAFVNFAQAAILHRAGPNQRCQPASGHLSMWESGIDNFYATVYYYCIHNYM